MDLTLSAFDFTMALDDGVEKPLLSSLLGVYMTCMLGAHGGGEKINGGNVHGRTNDSAVGRILTVI